MRNVVASCLFGQSLHHVLDVVLTPEEAQDYRGDDEAWELGEGRLGTNDCEFFRRLDLAVVGVAIGLQIVVWI